MSTIWKLTAIGPTRVIQQSAQALEAVDPAPALGWSCFEDGEPETSRLDILFAEADDFNRMKEHLPFSEEGLEVDFHPLPEEDWVRLSLEGLKPVKAGRFVVHGLHDTPNLEPGQIAILIEAGPAFGTGHHGTTKGCLIACERLDENGFKPRTILDLGCGTGVLAIGAVKLWPESHVLASDIDPDAVAETDINADKNIVSGSIESIVADGFNHDQLGPSFDLIFANILAGPLQDLATALAQRLRPEGRAILSGLLVEQIEAVRDAYHAAGLSLTDTDIIEGWAILTLKHAEPAA